ncbi:MAG: YccF domain-containing protein [Alistipes sp.]
MGCFLNVIWHFPFLGFLFALGYALLGALMCCTVILMPIGLGWLQFAKFLLAPFSSAMVSREDYEMITGEKQNGAYAAFSLVIRILYLPFGCLAAIGTVCVIAAEFVSLIGIPCGIVWAKSLKTIFNPIGKVCVPKVVADEIERVKSTGVVDKYRNRNSDISANRATASVGDTATEATESLHNARPKVRTFGDARLAEIVDNPEMYNADLVDKCRHEIEIRRKSEAMKDKVASFDTAKLREILADEGTYAEELVYCCQMEFDKRAELRRREEELEQERLRIEREKAAEAERIRRSERIAAVRERCLLFWKQWRWVICAVAVLAIAGTGYAIYAHAQRVEQEKIRLEQERQAEIERARLERERQLAEQQRQEREQREAEQQRLEQQRKEAERLKQEEKKILADEAYRRRVGAYIVGEYHATLAGIVFWVDKTYKHGKVLSFAEMSPTRDRNGYAQSGDYNDARAWCKTLGGKWRLPTIAEWESLPAVVKSDSRMKLNKEYWSSTAHFDDCHWCYLFKRDGSSRRAFEQNDHYFWARAVAEF